MPNDDIPNFFSTLWGAASDIPRAQPFAEELSVVAAFNEQVRQAAMIVARTSPRVSALVTGSIPTPLDRPVAKDELRDWREQVNMHVVRAAGFASEGYVRLKLASARAFIMRLLVQVCDVPEKSPLAHAIAAVVEAWASGCELIVNGNVGALHWLSDVGALESAARDYWALVAAL